MRGQRRKLALMAVMVPSVTLVPTARDYGRGVPTHIPTRNLWGNSEKTGRKQRGNLPLMAMMLPVVDLICCGRPVRKGPQNGVILADRLR